MEQKKKRVRPTVAQVRALERKNAVQDGVINGLLEECKGLKKKVSEFSSLQSKYKVLEERVGELQGIVDTQAGCLTREREAYARLVAHGADSDAKLAHLTGRGFWARLFNK